MWNTHCLCIWFNKRKNQTNCYQYKAVILHKAGCPVISSTGQSQANTKSRAPLLRSVSFLHDAHKSLAGTAWEPMKPIWWHVHTAPGPGMGPDPLSPIMPVQFPVPVPFPFRSQLAFTFNVKFIQLRLRFWFISALHLYQIETQSVNAMHLLTWAFHFGITISNSYQISCA